ncbi:uncharacterized protein LOC123292081 isoform X3 [Chrysoperla carnea]|uniref:uncharacterized protein LOC123292081 isoform X3 n=1 Tax=Chrysoperla carnea TaxID=189513 RepID=UPI001D05C874|nr:uncharacterized protein LOC123292081 isoform X3 [Chrysoperla carnea]
MHRTGLLLSIVVFVAVYSTVYCAPYPGDAEDLANRPFHLLQKRPAVVNSEPSDDEHNGASPIVKRSVGTYNNNLGSSSNFRSSSTFSSNSSPYLGSTTYINTKDIFCTTCLSSANGAMVTTGQILQSHSSRTVYSRSQYFSSQTSAGNMILATRS